MKEVFLIIAVIISKYLFCIFTIPDIKSFINIHQVCCWIFVVSLQSYFTKMENKNVWKISLSIQNLLFIFVRKVKQP